MSDAAKTTRREVTTTEGIVRMIAKKIILCGPVILTAEPALAQVELKTYADRDGYLDVQKLTCAQLANTFQEDADYLAAWYSGWYNGLAKKHVMQVARAKSLQHEVIVHCKANQDKKIIEAIDVVFKDYRAAGTKMKK
ncbi:HdeA/HdeB family chaperone [Bradyrhizobium genosp. SA-3]|uniref:HdeA/HdeB family chaperone n=1 Tax=Bradyrhizobium genosp. SA-3 TaxID=508868 RepID=UPI003D9B79C2